MSIILLLFLVLIVLAVVFSFVPQPQFSRFSVLCLALSTVMLSILVGVIHL